MVLDISLRAGQLQDKETESFLEKKKDDFSGLSIYLTKNVRWNLVI